MDQEGFDEWVGELEHKRHGKAAVRALDKALAQHGDRKRVRRTALEYCHLVASYDPGRDVFRELCRDEEHFIDSVSQEALAAAKTLLANFNREFPQSTSGFGMICRLTQEEQVGMVRALLKVEAAMLRAADLTGTAPAAPWFCAAGGLRYTKPVHHQNILADRETALGLGLTELFCAELGGPNYRLAALLIQAATGEDVSKGLKGRLESLVRRNPGISFSGFHSR